MSAGYSGTPLPKKLGIKPGVKVVLLNAPENYLLILGEIPEDVQFLGSLSATADMVHLFVTTGEELNIQLKKLRQKLKDDAFVWVSWPKKAAKIPTTVTEDTIRKLALPLGFVDIKVCAVNEVWSGLKLVIRKELRTNE
jgi:hypothetical protein